MSHLRAPSGIGAPPTRKEDPRLLTGASCFTDDIALAGSLMDYAIPGADDLPFHHRGAERAARARQSARRG
ncbi:MAG: hypothetical protein ACREKS_04060 [Candidatus Rokuibacteriota bacterium]